jgi:alkylation response protein AidB-like acyl-CoA dehydrogenase
MDVDTHELIQDNCRRFAESVLWPCSKTWETQRNIPRSVFERMGEMGLFGMTVPAEAGGGGADYVAYAVAMMEIAAGNAAVSTIMGGQNSVGCMPLLNYGSDEQKSRYLPAMISGKVMSAFALTEPQSGSDASNLTTRARRHGKGWVLNGTKQFITGGSTSDIAFVFAVTDPAVGRRGISAFIVPTDTAGYSVSRIEEKMGQHASDTCELVLKDLELPDNAMLGQEGDGYRIALSNLEGGRIGIAAQCVGVARQSLELARAYAQERKAFGKTISAYQGVSFRLADMATALSAAEQLVFHAASLKSAGVKCLKEVSMAKLFASEMAERVCSDAIQTFGGNGYMKDYDVERLYRDVRVGKIYEGTNDIQRLVIAREMGLAAS